MKAQAAALGLALATLVPHQDTAKKPALPEVGQPAPTLRLNNHQGKAVAISPTGPADEEKTWTVLAFFPKAATPG